MRFSNRNEFIKAQSSEKITLAHVHAKQRLYTFNGPSSLIYSKTLPYFLYELKQNDSYLTRVNSLLEIDDEGKFYYDIKTSTVYVRFFLDANPKLNEIIATYRFFYSDKPLTTTWDLNNISDEVFYQGRIKSSPGYKHEIGIDQSLTSLIGSGNLVLHASDGGLDEIYDKLIFENQRVAIYSWNSDLDANLAKVIYKGKITNKSFDSDQISFTVKDNLYDLLQTPNNSVYGELDNVNDSVKGQYKRLVYGRVDGLKCQSVDQIKDGFQLTGTISGSASSKILTGLGTQFLTEVFQDDELTIETQKLTVEKILSNTSIEVSSEPDFSFTNKTATNQPQRGFSGKNRTFQATEHVGSQQTKTIVSVPQLNRIVLNDTNGLFAGDFIEFTSNGERIEIKNIAPGNIVVLRQNVIVRPVVGTTAIRKPIQKVYISGKIVPSNSYIINNTTHCGLTFDSTVEFDIAPVRTYSFNLQFTNGSRQVTYTGTGDISLGELFEPGDFVKPSGITFNNFYKISYIDNNVIYLNQNYTDTTINQQPEYKKPNYITDETVISVDILGKTEDGSAEGVWISTIAQAERDLLRQLNVVDVNETSFTQGQLDGNQLVSIAIPEDFTDKSLPKVKDVIDKLNKSISSSLTLDNNLDLKFQVLNAFTGQNLITIDDFQVIDWKLQATNGKIYNKTIAKYRFSDVINETLETGNKIYDFDSEFVNRYIESGQTSQLDLYLYNDFEARINAHRNIYLNRLSFSTVTIKTDLRLENVEIGNIVIVDFERMYKRFGDQQTRKKVMLVSGKTVTGESIEFKLTDLGNTFNTSAYITENTANEYGLASIEEKLVNGYITDNQGIIDDLEQTAGINLIS